MVAAPLLTTHITSINLIMVKYFLNSLTLLNNAPVINIESYLYSYAKYVVLKSIAYGFVTLPTFLEFPCLALQECFFKISWVCLVR